MYIIIIIIIIVFFFFKKKKKKKKIVVPPDSLRKILLRVVKTELIRLLAFVRPLSNTTLQLLLGVSLLRLETDAAPMQCDNRILFF